MKNNLKNTANQYYQAMFVNVFLLKWAQVSDGGQYVGLDGATVTIDRFGLSGNGNKVLGKH